MENTHYYFNIVFIADELSIFCVSHHAYTCNVEATDAHLINRWRAGNHILEQIANGATNEEMKSGLASVHLELNFCWKLRD